MQPGLKTNPVGQETILDRSTRSFKRDGGGGEGAYKLCYGNFVNRFQVDSRVLFRRRSSKVYRHLPLFL